MHPPNVKSNVTYTASQSAVNSDTSFGVMSGMSGGDGEECSKPGPEPDRLKIDVPFEEGLRRALKKKKPKDGWPESDEPQPDNGS